MAESTDFSKTLHLPQTDFAMRANLAQREPAWVQRWLDMDVYGKLRAKRALANAPKYIVHLGPPYANGNMHMGHALTYVLKDFVVRSKFMAGFDSPYAPGWDCHGLPIEWKVETDLRAEGKTKYDISKAELRKRCRDYAQKWVNVQKSEWQRFGAMGDWDRPYLTMAPQNEAGIVRELGKMVERGFVYRGLKSIQWSWAEETALAEAEVEYDDNHKSTAVYVALPVVGRENEYLVIWTTTPWTLPANRAVAVAKDEVYVSLQFEGKTIWVAEALADGVAAKLGITPEIGPDSFKGSEMVGIKVHQPLYAMEVPVVLGAHVTTDAGTGLVHTAPAHGAEDFVVGQEYGLDLTCPVDGAGKYEEWVQALPNSGKALAGRHVFDKDVQQDILNELQGKGWLLKAEPIVHKYPISWRSKKPLIFRTTEQWFVSMDKPIDALGGESLRDASLDRIFARNGKKGVQWVPGYGANRIGSMIENRPDWCISRQRAWGVPITIISLNKLSTIPNDKTLKGVDPKTGIITDPVVWEHIAQLFEKEGIDAWDNRIGNDRETELFPEGWLEAHGIHPDRAARDCDFARDILDVWFDSGTTHAHVLRAESGEGQRFYRNDGKRPADLYQEGSDQHRGWFHSSLLTSVANYGDAPYESVVTSGFVVDGEGRKFSKSLGNGVEPRSLLDKYGMDIIRLWVASSDYSEDIRYSPQIMDSTADAYRRFRNTFRWLLGNLNGVQDMPLVVDDLPELERYMLHRLGVVMKDVRAHFDAFQFHKAYRALYEFCGSDLSNFYFDVRKDVLYCDADNSALRQATLSVLVQVFRTLVTHLAPLMPFTTDEAWRERYGEETCVHLEEFQPLHEVDVNAEMWAGLMALRDRVNVELEKLRAAGGLGANTEASVLVDGAFNEELVREVCGVSQVQNGTELKVAKHSGYKCPRCWRHYDKLEASGVCLRCDEAVATVKAA